MKSKNLKKYLKPKVKKTFISLNFYNRRGSLGRFLEYDEILMSHWWHSMWIT